MITRYSRMAGAVALGASVALLSACWGGSNDDDVASGPPTATTVPDGAGASSVSFVNFIKALAVSDETSEPMTFNSTFVAPAEDTSDPAPIV